LPSSSAKTLPLLNKEIIACTACPRLVQWREEVAVTKRKSYEDEKYWGKPVPSFGSDKPKLMIIGLAPGAHVANRTGRIFTADSSLGSFAWQATISTLRQLGHEIETTKFAHGAKVTFKDGNKKIMIIGSYHPSQQNTFTGKLTKAMLDKVIKQAAKAAGIG